MNLATDTLPRTRSGVGRKLFFGSLIALFVFSYLVPEVSFSPGRQNSPTNSSHSEAVSPSLSPYQNCSLSNMGNNANFYAICGWSGGSFFSQESGFTWGGSCGGFQTCQDSTSTTVSPGELVFWHETANGDCSSHSQIAGSFGFYDPVNVTNIVKITSNICEGEIDPGTHTTRFVIVWQISFAQDGAVEEFLLNGLSTGDSVAGVTNNTAPSTQNVAVQNNFKFYITGNFFVNFEQSASSGGAGVDTLTAQGVYGLSTTQVVISGSGSASNFRDWFASGFPVSSNSLTSQDNMDGCGGGGLGCGSSGVLVIWDYVGNACKLSPAQVTSSVTTTLTGGTAITATLNPAFYCKTDVILIGGHVILNASDATVSSSDTLHNSYVLKRGANVAPFSFSAYILEANMSSVCQFSCSSFTVSLNSTVTADLIFEAVIVHGIRNVSTATSIGTSALFSTTCGCQVQPIQRDFFLFSTASSDNTGPGVWTLTASNYTGLNNGGYTPAEGEYLLGGGTTGTSSQKMNFSQSSTKTWAEASISYAAASTGAVSVQPLQCTMFKAGPEATLTLGGLSSPVPATLPCDGAQHLINITSTAAPILSMKVSNSSGSSVVNHVGVIISAVPTGDTLVVGATGALRSGIMSTVLISPPGGLFCNQVVANGNGLSGDAVSISTCVNVGGGTYTFNAVWTSSVCGLNGPCGFMAIYVYDFTGASYSFNFTNGNNAALSSSSPSTNSIKFNSGSFLIGFDSINTAHTIQSAGSGFSLGTCFTSAVNNAQYACTETNSNPSSTTSTFPFTLNQSSSWSDEGIAVENGLTTLIITEPADTATTRDRFAGLQTAITLAPCTQGTCSLYSFTNYFQILKPLSYSVASGTPSGGTFPTITFSSAGNSQTSPLTITQQKSWIDNFTNGVPLNPWFSNLQSFTPNPDFMMTNVTAQNIVYTSGGSGNCNGLTTTNTTILFQNGCFIPGLFWTFANVITPAGTYTLIFVFPESLAIFLKSRDMLLTFSVASLLAGTVNAATRSLPLYAVAIIVLIGGAMLAATFLRLVRKESVG